MKVKQKGFTLVELVVVMAIIAVLASLALFAINAARLSARNTTRRGDIQTFRTANEAYFSSNKTYVNGNGVNIYWMMSPGGASTLCTATVCYTPGFNKHDPKGSSEDGRGCYTFNGSNKYWLGMLPEPTAYGGGSGTTCNAVSSAYSSPWEDYSVQ